MRETPSVGATFGRSSESPQTSPQLLFARLAIFSCGSVFLPLVSVVDRIDFTADPYPAFFVNADTDADPALDGGPYPRF
jgi:hypothetical protein